MKILMLVPFLPNTSMSGGQTRWYNIIKYLSEKHQITLFSLIKDESEKRFIPELKKYCKKVKVFKRSKSPWTFRNLFLTIFSPYPLLVVRNWSPKEKRAIKKELLEEKYDLIHAETFYVMPHIPKTAIPSILVEQTIEYLVYKHHVDIKIPFLLKPLFMIDVLKLRFWEKYFWRKTNKLVAVSEEDKKIMQKLIPGIKVDIVPNGVDSKYFSSYKKTKKYPPRILYGAANFKWLQNVEAVNLLLGEVWPKIKERMRDVKLWIVGKSIPSNICQLAKRTDDIEIAESVPDVRDTLKTATVMILPIRGPGGTRLKVLEALAAGLPVVSTSTGAAGLNLEHGRHVLISDTDQGLANATVKLLKNPELAKKIGRQGQGFVEKNYDWKVVVQLHDRIYKKVVHV